MNDLRNENPRIGASVRTLAELQFALLGSGDIVMPVTATAWRMTSQYSDLRALRIADGPQSTAAVISRPAEDREHVLSFIRHARETAKCFLGKVPFAVQPQPEIQQKPRGEAPVKPVLSGLWKISSLSVRMARFRRHPPRHSGNTCASGATRRAGLGIRALAPCNSVVAADFEPYRKT